MDWHVAEGLAELEVPLGDKTGPQLGLLPGAQEAGRERLRGK